MKQKSLYLLCGTPASGKSTWIRNQTSPSLGNKVTISRDAIRFAILKDNQDYFSQEKTVFKTFYSQIQEAINTSFVDTIFVDATHLNEKSRNKVLDKLNLENVKIYAVDFTIPVETCIERNENRAGRAYVPPDAIRQMASQYVPPHDNEKYHYDRIIHIGE